MKRIDVRRSEGQAMAEFALIAPVFLLLVVGILVVGRLFFYWIEANHVANETVRWAVVDRNPYYDTTACSAPTGLAPCQTLQQHARSTGTDEFENRAKVCIDFPSNAPTDPVEVGDPVRVRVQVPASFFGFFDFNVTVRGSATMRVERLAGEDPTDPTKPPVPENYTASSWPSGAACS